MIYLERYHRFMTMNQLGADLSVAPRWGGAALLRSGVLAFAGSIGPTDVHAHHAVQIITATTPFSVLDGHGARHRATKVVVPADAPHRIEAGAHEATVMFLEPESQPGRAAHTRAVRSGWTVTPVLGVTRRRALVAVVDELIAHLTPATAEYGPAARHPAIDEGLRLLPDLVAAGPVSGTELAAQVGLSASRLAAQVGLSASRLTHLFTEQVGIPLRRYVLWSRLRIAITRVQAGDDLTAAAHGAGFADSAHLTRTTREMFGLPPSVLSRHVSWDLDSG
ncbi:transcriptional regulator, AraC family (plasmid) [Mycolicibacterium chubuense NBB4]|uniref:Transcriptional regulator, AraC family n=2 Tax=Mycolicibacterium chubuense TaxID=1800 RepID=I4BSR4_MYCCN|nr:transcriptional regulator, AraC family [Mycolicibacterium chubuense NBB4]